MVKIKIPQHDGKVKQYGSRPMSFGLQKAIARYGREAMEAVAIAKGVQGKQIDMDDDADLENLRRITEVNAALQETKADIIVRAFGGQFSLDELDEVPADEIDAVIAALQDEANGIVRKNG